MKIFLILSFYISSALTSQIDPPEIDYSQMISMREVNQKLHYGQVLPSTSPPERNARIFGGTVVQPHSHPYHVALQVQTSPISVALCAGSVLSNRAVLTAAACIDIFPSLHVVAGAHNIRNREASQQRKAVQKSAFRVHPAWNRANLANDIAIIILPSALILNSFVSAARLPFGLESEMFVGQRARVIGWGTTGQNQGTSDLLRQAINTVITDAQCAAGWQMAARTTLVCTSSGGQGPCSSDLGGSLTVPRAGDSRPVVIGITSFGLVPCQSTKPFAYTRVTRFLGWIVTNQNP